MYTMNDLKKYTSLEIVEMLDKGTCPFCLKNGYRIIGSHIGVVHKIPINEIKDYLMLPRSHAFISDKELQSKMRDRALNQGFGKDIKGTNKIKNHDTISKLKSRLTKSTFQTDELFYMKDLVSISEDSVMKSRVLEKLNLLLLDIHRNHIYPNESIILRGNK